MSLIVSTFHFSSRSSVVQGYFPQGVLQPSVPPQQKAIQPRMAQGGGQRRPPSYQELTIQAHQRSSGSAVQAAGNRTAFALPPHLTSFARCIGQKLPTAVQQKMESFFGADFSDVQVHTGTEASSIGALAFTQGANIYFAPGQYNPNSHFGQQLLAHELTHVLQQRAGRVRNPFGSGIAVVQDPALESEAERMGTQAAMHVPLMQAKMAKANSLQRAVPPHVSGPMKVRDGIHKITVAQDGRQTGSVMVHSKDRATIEVTDLGVDTPHRGKGLGQKLLASALRAGLRLGKKRVSLGVDDNGSGRLAKWYKQMGFRQTGVDHEGRPRMEAPINKVLSGVAQGRMSTVGAFPSFIEGLRTRIMQKAAPLQRSASPRARVLQRAERDPAEDNYDNLVGYRTGFMDEIEAAFLKNGYTKDNLRRAILAGLKAWGGTIPGHLSSSADKDSGEQGKTGTQCEKAKTFLIKWASEHPAGTKPKADPSLRHDDEKAKEVAASKQKEKRGREKDKHTEWHEKQGHTPAATAPPGKYCSECGKIFNGMR